MSQNERMTSDELEFLAKRNKAVNFKEQLTSEKEARVSELYQKALPQLKSGLICVKGFVDGVDVDLIDYRLTDVNATNFYYEDEERYLLFSFSSKNNSKHFAIMKQREIDQVTEGEYEEIIDEFSIALTKYYSAITKDFDATIEVKAGRVEELNEAVRRNADLIEGDYEYKRFEVNKSGLPLTVHFLSDINVMTNLYNGVSKQLEAEKISQQVKEEQGAESAKATEEKHAVEVQPSKQTQSNRLSGVSHENPLTVEGNVMKKEIIEEEKTTLYKPQFGALNPVGLATDALGDLGLLSEVPLEVVVVLGSTKRTLKDVLDFGVGRIIELEKSEDDPLLIYVNGQLLAEGEVVIVDENYAIKITKLFEKREILAGI